MKAEDILPDRQDRIRLGGVEIRKGSVGAFIANARLLLEEELPAAQRRQAEEDLRALLPAIRALGLLELFELRDARLRTLVADWGKRRWPLLRAAHGHWRYQSSMQLSIRRCRASRSLTGVRIGMCARLPSRRSMMYSVSKCRVQSSRLT